MHINAVLDGLNPKQIEAVTLPLGNSLVLAGAGSGKTRVLVSRMAYLASHYALPLSSLLAVTFTNKAAAEMRGRLADMTGYSVQSLWVGTFHGICHKMLRLHYEAAKLSQHFQILDSDDQARLIKRVLQSLNLPEDRWPVKQVQAYINGQKDEGFRPQHVHVHPYGPSKTYLQIYKAYEALCQTADVIDFAEIILRTYEMLRDNPELLAHYHTRFKAILVDEFQDTNAIQYAWLKLLAQHDTAVMAVGDDDQSIYGWRGAKVENIKHFMRDYENTSLIRLEQNYRSTKTILEASNALIDNNASRMGKTLWTEGDDGQKITVYAAFNEIDEARFIADKIKAAIDNGLRPDQIAILYRSNALSRVVEESLLRAHIPYRIYGGLRFLDRAEIKDTLAYLRLLANRFDDAAFERVVNFPTRGIGDKTLDDLRLTAREQSISLWQAANQLLSDNHFANRAANALQAFILLIDNLSLTCQDLPLAEQVSHIIETSGLKAHFSKVKGDKSDSKLENLDELVSAAKQYEFEDREDDGLPVLVSFLAHASLEAGEMQADASECSVHLMTLHAAKGLEFPWVFMVGLEEGIFPSRLSLEDPNRLEEERRLCYVGMTRAMKQLVISYAEIRRLHGREEYHKSSRFLREIPQEYLNEVRVKTRFETAKQTSIHQLESMSGYQLGQSVHHEKFGSGTILNIEGAGAHTRVQIKFENSDTKWLVLAYAKLTT